MATITKRNELEEQRVEEFFREIKEKFNVFKYIS